MAIRKLFLVGLSAALLNYVLPSRASWAQEGVPATASEDADYAQREAASKGLERFVGGDALGVVIAVLVIAALVVLIWYLLEHHYHHHHSRAVPGPSLPGLAGHVVPRPA